MNRIIASAFPLLICAAFAFPAVADQPLDPAKYSSNKRTLTKSELAKYLHARFAAPLQPLAAPNLAGFKVEGVAPAESMIAEAYPESLIKPTDLESDGSIRIERLNKILGQIVYPSVPPPGQPGADEPVIRSYAKTPEANPIERIFSPNSSPTNHWIVPILVRRNPDQASVTADKAQGAVFTYSDDRLHGKTTWYTEGALISPVTINTDRRSDPAFQTEAQVWEILPAAGWKVTKVGGTSAGAVEELQFQAPLTWSANTPNAGIFKNQKLGIKPYYLTDFSFKGAVEGVSLDYTPLISDEHLSGDGSTVIYGFAINDVPLRIFPGRNFWYHLNMVPKLDYNHLSSTSRYIERTGGENYFRAGGKAELGISYTGAHRADLAVSYEVFEGLTGAPHSSDLLSLKASLAINEFVGITTDYQKGTTPVANKSIDLITVGLEVKF